MMITYKVRFKNNDNVNSLYIAIDMNLVSLYWVGALRVIMHKRIPQLRNNASTVKKKKKLSMKILK